MLYLPEKGHMWDTSIVFHEGKYYLFSMLCYENQDCKYVHCAVSDDGVHFHDHGAVIKDQPAPVWKMFVHRFGGRYVMNHGSLSGKAGHGNDTLRFFTSDNLLDWRYEGEEHDLHPDPRWYRVEERFDHMYTLEYNGIYYGYVVATPKEGGQASGCGMMASEDGLHYTPLPPPVIEWGDVPPTNFEVGGCERIGEWFYLIGGTIPHYGNHGYSVFTFVAKHPTGPFRPCLPGYRLCGNARADRVAGVQWLASLARAENEEVVITNYLTSGYAKEKNFIGTYENVWFLPIKKAVAEPDGGLKMGYWQRNELAKGEMLELPFEETILRATEDSNAGWEHAIGNYHAHAFIQDCPENGMILEGSFQIEDIGHFNAPAAGFILGNESELISIALPVEHPSLGRAEIKLVNDLDFGRSVLLDEVGPCCAGARTITIQRLHSFRLWVRKGMFELYVDDILVQSYVCELNGTLKCGLYAYNGIGKYASLKAYRMTL